MPVKPKLRSEITALLRRIRETYRDLDKLKESDLAQMHLDMGAVEDATLRIGVQEFVRAFTLHASHVRRLSETKDDDPDLGNRKATTKLYQQIRVACETAIWNRVDDIEEGR